MEVDDQPNKNTDLRKAIQGGIQESTPGRCHALGPCHPSIEDIGGPSHENEPSPQNRSSKSECRSGGRTQSSPTLFSSDGPPFLENPLLREELFGPSSLIIRARSREELLRIAAILKGHLTASIHGSEQDLMDYSDLTAVLQRNVYREVARRIDAEIGERPGRRWFVGHWGFQFYFERIGFRAGVPPQYERAYGRSELARDDWIATARNAG